MKAGKNNRIIIDGHAHACGEYLTVDGIKQKLSTANADIVLLTPGQYGSKTTYGLKNLAKEKPMEDVVSKNNRTTSIMISLIGAIRQIPKGNEYVYRLKCALPEYIRQCYWVTKSNWVTVPEDYEKADALYAMMELFMDSLYEWFECSDMITKGALYAVERVEALEKMHFVKSDKPLIGHHQKLAYNDYWIRHK